MGHPILVVGVRRGPPAKEPNPSLNDNRHSIGGVVSDSQISQSPRLELAEAILQAKLRSNLSFQDLAAETDLSLTFVTASLLGQHPLPGQAAEAIGKKLNLTEDQIALLQTIPLRGSIPGGVPTDPTIYRFYEIVQVYGSTLKALVHELFGDGIISAIDFRLDIKKVEDPEGGSRAVITLDGKFLPSRPY
jgi:cyanate lyase